MAYKVIIATRSFGSTSQKPWDLLAEAGCEVFRADMSKKMTEERLIDLLHDMEAVIYKELYLAMEKSFGQFVDISGQK